MQWNLILALVFAFIVGLFAVVNVESVSVKYIFGSLELPLILVIIGSALAGGLIIGLVGIFRQAQLHWKLHNLDKQYKELEQQMQQQNQALQPQVLISEPEKQQPESDPKQDDSATSPKAEQKE